MKIYHYDHVTGEFLFEDEAQLLPLPRGYQYDEGTPEQDKYQLPAMATFVMPPNAGDKQIAVISEGVWSIIQDRRGETWLNANGERVEVSELGDPIDAGFITQVPDEITDEHRFIDGVWVLPPLEPKYPDADAAKLALVHWVNQFTEQITGPIPKDEKLAWDKKELVARAVDAGTATPEQTSFLQAEADLTGETLQALATRIIGKADKYADLISLASGLRRTTYSAIDAESDPQQYEAILLNAQSQAMQMAQEKGFI